MVPVRLQLRNFLSYGEDAPVLDFEGIHVACLSGGNGQGKSALLDAMTWALWGEARKSSDLRKPDEEVLRIGARSMEVDFTFRVDGTEHRIVRSYTQSASGKTSKPGLELQVRDGGDWRALTAESVKATQEAIDARLGIDYETFINSTFLLQGRSDEFTKKKPGERKEILSKILGLDRYERMAGRASARWSRQKERVQALEAEAERLTGALEHEGAWNADLADVEVRLAEVEAERAAAVAAETEAAARLARLDAAAREAEALRVALSDLDARTQKLDADRQRLTTQAEEADALIAKADAIEADHARYETLRQRRTALDETATLFRGIESQRHGLRLDLQRATAEAEARVTKAEAALRTLQERKAEDERRLEGRPRVEASLKAATEAATELKTLEAVRATRAEATARIEAIDKRLASERGTLEGKRLNVMEEGKRLAAEVAEPEAHDLDALAAAVAEGEAAASRLEALREEGVELSATVKTLEARIETAQAQRTTVAGRRTRILQSQDDACPTCGTPLTDAHRQEVAQTYAQELGELDAAVAAATTDRDAAQARRDALRTDYARLKASADAGAAAAQQLATARDRLQRRTQSEARLNELREEARRLKRQLADEAFGQALRAERAELADVLDANPLDEAHLDAVRRDAGLRDHWASELRDLDRAAERLAQTAAEAKRKETDLAERQQALDAGAHGAPFRAKLDALDQQAARLGYDPQEHEAVSRDLDALSDAPARLSRLLDARRSRADLAERLAGMADDRRALVADRESKAEALAALTGRLADREAAEAARARAAASREDAARRLSEAQAQRGALRERLDRAARDRDALKQTRADLKDAKRERALYGHLRRAFGRHGIPSLIIEETLPEIEDRANALLEPPRRRPHPRRPRDAQRQENRRRHARDARHPHHRRAGRRPVLRDVLRRRGLPRQLRAPHRAQPDARRALRHPHPHARGRRGVWDAGQGGPPEPDRRHPRHPGRLRHDPRDHAPRRDQGRVPRPHRGPQGARERLHVRGGGRVERYASAARRSRSISPTPRPTSGTASASSRRSPAASTSRNVANSARA